LQARIRPHFLFNTLNTAIALVRVDPARAEAVLEDLSELFRAALVDGGTQATTTLEQEVALARRYLAIEQLRFGERLQVRWDLDPSGNQARVPPLLLQPLVENAVRHGVEPAAAGGTIRVRTRVRRGQVEIAVVNTVPTEASTPGHGIALMNVRERLRLMHDVTADFRAGRDGSLYRVRILVPL
jgi:two-component system sensor histidine kinase AlgZ